MTATPPRWVGYSQGDVMELSSIDKFYMIDDSGNCLPSSDSTKAPFSLRFGVNTNLYCIGNQSLPSLFTSFSGKTINQFKGDISKNITLPTIGSTATSVTLKFIVGSYGTQRSKYVERVTL